MRLIPEAPPRRADDRSASGSGSGEPSAYACLHCIKVYQRPVDISRHNEAYPEGIMLCKNLA